VDSPPECTSPRIQTPNRRRRQRENVT
jgi:hypothetical protein